MAQRSASQSAARPCIVKARGWSGHLRAPLMCEGCPWWVKSAVLESARTALKADGKVQSKYMYGSATNLGAFGWCAARRNKSGVPVSLLHEALAISL
jgi:hypothetical protein